MGEEEAIVNPKIRYPSGLQCYFYTIFITQKKYRFDNTSKKMGIKEDTLRAYAQGELPITVTRFLDFMRVTGDIEYLIFLARELGYVVVPQLKDEKIARALTELLKTLGAIYNGGKE